MLRALMDHDDLLRPPRVCVRVPTKRRSEPLDIRGRRREGFGCLRSPLPSTFLPLVFRVSADGEFVA